jgi:hypothetical protein
MTDQITIATIQRTLEERGQHRWGERRGPVAQSRLRRLEDGRYEYTPKKGVTFTLTAEALVRRLVALVPPPRRHLTSFHGVYAPTPRSAVANIGQTPVGHSPDATPEDPLSGRRAEW